MEFPRQYMVRDDLCTLKFYTTILSFLQHGIVCPAYIRGALTDFACSVTIFFMNLSGL